MSPRRPRSSKKRQPRPRAGLAECTSRGLRDIHKAAGAMGGSHAGCRPRACIARSRRHATPPPRDPRRTFGVDEPAAPPPIQQPRPIPAQALLFPALEIGWVRPPGPACLPGRVGFAKKLGHAFSLSALKFGKSRVGFIRCVAPLCPMPQGDSTDRPHIGAKEKGKVLENYDTRRRVSGGAHIHTHTVRLFSTSLATASPRRRRRRSPLAACRFPLLTNLCSWKIGWGGSGGATGWGGRRRRGRSARASARADEGPREGI